MAVNKGGQGDGGVVSKSQAVRDYLKEHPKAKMREIADALAAKGIKIQHSQIYSVMYKVNGQKRKARRAAAMEVSRSTGAVDPVRLVLKVRDLAVEAGGIRKLKELVDAIAQ
jgi:uncharacterized protein YneF (UPF0154 family)